MAASRSSTATPMWSMLPNTGPSVPSAPVRIALAANRASGGGLDSEPLLAAMRERGAEVAGFGCEEGDLERVAAWAPDRLAMAGGDGTIGPVAELAGRLDVPLAVLPTGTANDFARAYGVPADRLAATALAVDGEHTRPLDLGRLADGRPFVNVASAGLASVAARNAQPLKPRFGPLAYAIGALHAAAREHPLPVTVRVDDRTAFDDTAWQVIVAVSGAFGAGAGVAEADPDDGVLDVVILPAGSRAGLARRAWGLRTRTIAQQRGVPHERGHVVEVRLPDGSEINVDGEIRAGGLERVTVEPAAFRLVVPYDATDGVRLGQTAGWMPGGATTTPSRPRRLTS
jgi:diacylglycerol kinase (ATP)